MDTFGDNFIDVWVGMLCILMGTFFTFFVWLGDTVAIIQLRTKKELGDRKSKFDWLDFIN